MMNMSNTKDAPKNDYLILRYIFMQENKSTWYFNNKFQFGVFVYLISAIFRSQLQVGRIELRYCKRMSTVQI